MRAILPFLVYWLLSFPAYAEPYLCTPGTIIIHEPNALCNGCIGELNAEALAEKDAEIKRLLVELATARAQAQFLQDQRNSFEACLKPKAPATYRRCKARFN